MRTENLPPHRCSRPASAAIRRIGLAAAAAAAALAVACEAPRPAPRSSIVRPSAARVAPAPNPVQQRRLATAQETAAAGDYEEALRLFQSLLSENPTLTTAFIGIGEVHLARGNYRDAEPAYARAVRLEPGSFDAQFGHARVLQLLERFTEAVRAYQRAITIRPHHLEANLGLSTAYLQLGEPALAVPFAERSVHLDPDSGAARSNLGAAYERVGRTADAIRQYEIAMELLETSPQLLMNLMNAYIAERRFREAISTGEVLAGVDPAANVFERMAFAHFRLGEYPQSRDLYRRAVEIDPAHFPSWNGIGVNALNAWLASERNDAEAMVEAREAFRTSLRINPDQPRVVSLLSRYYAG